MVVRHWFLATVLMVTAFHCSADTTPDPECWQREVEVHVRQQFAIYGPQSVRHEYFGFIYVADDIIGSAVTRSAPCPKAGKCVVDSNRAVRSLPPRAKVLGEWHTHPQTGSPSLSRDDVHGAHRNRHMKCYFAFYSTPSGVIYAWDVNRISVPNAMASRARIGNYLEDRYEGQRVAAASANENRTPTQ